jgi:hypothetical protein
MQFWTGHFFGLFADSSCVVDGGDVLDWQEIKSVVRAMKRMGAFFFLNDNDFFTNGLFMSVNLARVYPHSLLIQI